MHKKMKFSIKDFFSKFDQTRRKLRIWSDLLKKLLMEHFSLRRVTLYTYSIIHSLSLHLLLVSVLLTLNIFHTLLYCSIAIVSIVNFEQVNADWEAEINTILVSQKYMRGFV